jgi:hypothetical protein
MQRPACLLLALLCCPGVFGCAGARPDPAPSLSPPEPSPAALAPLFPARWIENSGATLLGPALAEGSLLLLGGRRALVAKASGVHFEEGPSPEPLEDVILIPTEGGQRLVGRSRQTIYRFDDPLGAATPLVRADASISRFGAGSGVIAVWTSRSDRPIFIDAKTGEPRSLEGLPEPPLRAIAFLDMKRGAAVFEAAGLAVTTDGGTSWKIVTDTGHDDALRMNGLRRRGDALRAYAYTDGPDAAIDIASGRLAALEPQKAIEGEDALLHWVRLTGRDPLEVAAASGIEAPSGGVLLASHGLLARIDPSTSAVLELTEFARGKWMNPCSAARVGQTAWIACTLSEDQGKSDLFDPFGVFSIPLGQAALKADRPALVRNGEAELVVSPSGGAMLLGPCNTEDEAEACIRKGDGSWASVHLDTDLGGRGAGPMADGRIAFLRGIFEGDDGPELEGTREAPPAQASDDEATQPRRIHVALVDASGKEQALAPINVSTTGGSVRVQGAIEEEADHSLRFVIDGGSGAEVVIQPPGREAATMQRIAGATVARIRGGRGIAVGEGHIRASLDAGGTWIDLAAPPRVMEVASAIGNNPDGWTEIEVSDVGVKLGPVLRLGWGPERAVPPPMPSTEAPRLATPNPPPTGPDRILTCRSLGPATGTPPLLGGTQIKALFASRPPANGTRRETSSFAGGRVSMLDTIALLDEQGPDKKESPPATWTLKWFDPTELGGKPRSVTMPVYTKGPPGNGSGKKGLPGKPAATPKDMPWGASLRHAAASGARALFFLRADGKNLLVRAEPSGGVEVAPAKAELLPSGEVVFGTDRGEAIAWMHESTLVVWLAGEPPRAIASIPTHAARSLGQPTKDGVPVMLGSSDWAIMRVMPIPVLGKKAGEAPPKEAAPSLDGWTRAANLRRDLGAMDACTARSKGAEFIVQRSSVAAEVDGTSEVGSLSLYGVRVAGEKACIVAVSSFLTPDRRAFPSPPAPKEKGRAAPAETRGPLAFLRADLLGKRAEGGDRGVLPVSLRRLGCTLVPKP